MKVLLINQHTSNHGDEAAGKALLRALIDNGYKGEDIAIIYNSGGLLDIEKLNVDSQIKHVYSGKNSFIDKLLIRLTLIAPFLLIKYLFKFGHVVKYEYELIQSSEKIINAPGGVNIGPYKDWRYLWRLYVALKLKKQVAIYSISFGPIPELYLFRQASKYILKNVDFLSLRDQQSQHYADQLGIKYYPSIDTAFLKNNPDAILPNDIAINLNCEYVVVVPNQLYKWHPNFKDVSSTTLDKIYIDIINFFVNKKLKVVLLPQLFGHQNDSQYFQTLQEQTNDAKSVIVIDDKYSSDIQQKIISKALYLIGSRYHTIIFSINNERPFLSLAYEHKMTNTLELIGLQKHNILLKNIISNNVNILDRLEDEYSKKSTIALEVKNSNKNANIIAKDTLNLLVDNFLRPLKVK